MATGSKAKKSLKRFAKAQKKIGKKTIQKKQKAIRRNYIFCEMKVGTHARYKFWVYFVGINIKKDNTTKTFSLVSVHH